VRQPPEVLAGLSSITGYVRMQIDVHMSFEQYFKVCKIYGTKRQCRERLITGR
jgi:hypothetical protein